jgi:hypothetical protein
MSVGPADVQPLEEQERRAERQRRQRFMVRLGAGVLGVALTFVGALAVFATDNGAGAAGLLAIGGGLLILGLMAGELKTLRFGGIELELIQEAEAAEARGDDEAARVLRQAAATLSQRAGTAAKAYKSIRADMPAGNERTAKMEAVLKSFKTDAALLPKSLDPEEVLALLSSGSAGARVWALAVLQERPEYVTVRGLLEAVERPEDQFDWYHALVLADKYINLPSTRQWAIERICRVVRTQLNTGAYGTDSDCISRATAVLKSGQKQIDARKREPAAGRSTPRDS